MPTNNKPSQKTKAKLPKEKLFRKTNNKATRSTTKAKVSVPYTKEQLAKVKIDRSFGVTDLEKYLLKIQKNIEVFEDAILKERTEMKRVQGMIDVLKNDIKEAEALEDFAR